ncbi:hypothetical protein DEO72_LG10g2241 [Vigna unguiculata]|uniref:Kunitz inhibitor ST1-like n=1 Tax=Vigna unguiculata TaxID=3917 RepID=A0A4D6NCH4_VIGUN|nr:hypothetical protein DEO72_LG10g2241 [Vigna unguiculata]
MASPTLVALFLLSALTFYPPSTTAQPVKDANETIEYSLAFDIYQQGWRLQSLFASAFIPEGRIYISYDYVPQPGVPSNYWTAVEETIEYSLAFDIYQQGWRLQSLFASAFIPEGRIYISYDYVPQPGVPSNYWTAVEGEAERTVVKVGNVGIIRDDAGNRLLAINPENTFKFILVPLSSDASK